VLKLALLALAILLAHRLACARGASPSLASGLLLLALIAAAPRLTARNDLHGYWLAGLCGVLVEAGRREPRWLLALLPAGALWANLHGSFVVGWLIIAAGLLATPPPGARRYRSLLGAVLALQPALALVGPNGLDVYRQLVDHLLGAGTYRALIVEWQPLWRAPLLVQAPVHVLAALALLAALAPTRSWRESLPVGAALALACASQRFVLLGALLGVPGIAAGLTRALASTSGPLVRRAPGLALLLAAAAAAPVAWHARRAGPRPVLEREDAPLAAAAHLLEAAPAARLLAPFDAGPWLLWLTPRVRLYVDPRNTRGAAALRRYLDLLHRPELVEDEQRRLGIDQVLIDEVDPRMTPLARWLARKGVRAWPPPGEPGRFTLYRTPLTSRGR